MRDGSNVSRTASACSDVTQSRDLTDQPRSCVQRGALTLLPRTLTPPGLHFVDQVRYFLRYSGEIEPVPLLGGSVVEPRHDGGVSVYWRLPGPSVLETARRRASLVRYERLLREWSTETELQLDAPEPHLACWIKASDGEHGQDRTARER